MRRIREYSNYIKFIIIMIIMLIGVFYACFEKLTYLESAYLTNSNEDMIKVRNNIKQAFIMPYDILKGFSVKIGTQIDSDSKWNLILSDSEDNILYEKLFSFIDADVNQYYSIELEYPIYLEKGRQYFLSIVSTNLSNNSQSFYYISNDKTYYSHNSVLFVDDKEVDMILCMAINGGDRTFWWVFFYSFIVFIITLAGIRYIYIWEKGLRWYEDTVLLAFIIGLIIFALMFPFADIQVVKPFTDENDNIRGGMIIANGGVLYKNYVTQHTPLAYYLCAIFTLLGAVSVEQMRLLFYVVVSAVWSFIFYRNCLFFGKFTIFILSIAVTLGTKVMMGVYSTMILSDTIQEVCMIVLLLEFLAYQKKPLLDWKRCIIISLALWGAIGVAFISIYSIFILAICFVIYESKLWMSGKRTRQIISYSYIRLVMCILMPFVMGIIYFKLNHSLCYMYEQAYLFNRKVYPEYISIGDNLLEPFILGLFSLFSEIINSIFSIGQNSFSRYDFILLSVVSILLLSVILKIYKKIKVFPIIHILILLFMCSGASRGVSDFHAMAFWGTFITFVVILFDESICIKKHYRIIFFIAALYLCILLRPTIAAYSNRIAFKQLAISENEGYVVANTKNGEGIYIDTYCLDSIYLLYKERYPVSRLTYALPWYMDWYETWTITDISTNKPKLAIWNPDTIVWDYQYFCSEFNNYIEKNYTRLNENSIFWKLKE